MHKYEQHCVVAEKEWTIMGDGQPRKYYFAGLEWECVFKQRGGTGGGWQSGAQNSGNSVKLGCKDVANGKRAEVQVEVILSDRNYEPLDKQYPKRRLLNLASPTWDLSLYKSAKRSAAAANATTTASGVNLLNGIAAQLADSFAPQMVGSSLTDYEMDQLEAEEEAYYDDMDYMMGGAGGPHPHVTFHGGGGSRRHAYHSHLILTIRILEKRTALPNFLQPNLPIGHLKRNGTVQLGAQTFFVSKELLTVHSPVFHRLFTENLDNNVVLQHADTAEHARFNDFLLCMSLPGHKALPNPKNVRDLLKLAKIYEVNQVRDKCERHLKLCHEMSLDERILLAKEFGLGGLQLRIVQEMASPERCQILCQKLWDLLNSQTGSASEGQQ